MSSGATQPSPTAEGPRRAYAALTFWQPHRGIVHRVGGGAGEQLVDSDLDEGRRGENLLASDSTERPQVSREPPQ